MQPFRYEIAGNIYEQRPLVFGQVRQLATVLSGIKLPNSHDAAAWFAALGSRLLEALAVVLIPDGADQRSKDNSVITTRLEWDLKPDQALQIIEDFFNCNPISSIAGQLGWLETVGRSMARGEEAPSGASKPSFRMAR
ncbi:MAG: hypothetical protein V2A77_11065 [Pseudomonadota bacterium]